MSLFRQKKRRMPGLNTASLPDLIFTVLFFFMIVTHMRKVAVKVKYQVPQGTELTRLVKKSTVSYIYIGARDPLLTSPKGRNPNGGARERMVVQLNDKLATPAEVEGYIKAERDRMNPDDAQQMTVSIKADRKADMGIITDVKQALRHANALKISYSATQSPITHTPNH